MKVYYNEIEPYCVWWLKNLIDAGRLPGGYVDDRSIVDVDPDFLTNFQQWHFFAGIGGWPLALAFAGYAHFEGVATGSCPCQPFSSNGKMEGFNDERHLWPAFAEIIKRAKFPIVFGEQVASSLGREWLSGVRFDMEKMGYDFGAADLCAASVNSPQNRPRLWWCGFDRSPNTASWLNKQRGAQPNFRNMEGGDWEAYELISKSDGRAFRNKPGLSLLADGIPARVGKLRAFGNAIVPPLAAKFISASIDAKRAMAA